MVCPTYQPFEIAILDAAILLELKLNLDISLQKESIPSPSSMPKLNLPSLRVRRRRFFP